MGKNLHKLQVEIVAQMNKFKKTCDAVKAEARKTTQDANQSLHQIGDEKMAQRVTQQYDQIRKETKSVCDKIKKISKDAQVDAGILVPTDEYKELEKNIASAKKNLDSLTRKQKAMSDGASKVMTKEYAACAEQMKAVEKRLDSMIEKQIEWAALGESVTSSSAFKRLEEDIEAAGKEMDQYKAKMESMEKAGTAFQPSEKWKELRYQIREARELLRSYKDEEARMAAEGTDYRSTVKPEKQPKAQNPNLQVAKAFAREGKKALSGVITEAAKVHPALEKAIRLAEKFGNTARKAGGTASKAMKAAGVAVKVPVSFLKLLSTGFGKVYQKVRQGIPGLNRFRASSDSLANSCGKLTGRMGALRITATYMLASFMIMGGINAMKEGFKNLSQYSAKTNADLSMLMSSLMQLKNSLATAFAPILSVVAPILDTFINWLSAAMTAIAHFMAAITGQSQVVVSRKANQDFAGSIADTGSAADGAADSVEKYKRSLMGFDRINKLDSQDSGSGSSGGGSGGSGVSASDMFETVTVDSTFANWAEKFKEAWANADFTEIGSIVGEKLNNALENIQWDKIKETSRRIARSIATFLNGFIETTDWSLVGATFAEGINTIIEFAYTFVTTFDWSKFGKAISDTVNGFFATLDLSKAGQTLSEGIKGILDTITTAFEGIDWNAIGKSIGDFLTNIDWTGILASVGKAIASACVGALDLAEGLFKSLCEGLKNVDWSKVASDVWSLFKSAWGLVKAAADVAVSLIKSGWKTISGFIGTAVSVGISLVKKGFTTIVKYLGIGKALSVSLKLAKSGWKTIKKWLGIDGALKLKFKLPKIRVKWGEKKVAGFKISYPTGFETYAKGGFPEEGPFMMNRGEIAGKFSNGKGVVANNQQITTGIANAVGPAVYKAVLAAMSVKSDNNGNITVVLEGDAKGLFKVVKTEAERYTNTTGESAFPV